MYTESSKKRLNSERSGNAAHLNLPKRQRIKHNTTDRK